MKRPGGFDRNPDLPEPSRPPERREHPELPEFTQAPVPPKSNEGLSSDRKHVTQVDEVTELAELAESANQTEQAQVIEPGGSKKPGLSQLMKREPRVEDPVKLAEKRVREAERRNKRGQRRETKRFTAAIRRTRRRALVIASAVLALVLFVLIGAFTPIMAVRNIQVEGAHSVNVDDVTVALQRFEGVPLALVDENDVLHALTPFPLIQRFAVERIPPSTLLVRIEERVPAVAIENDGVVRLYDAAGVLVAEGTEVPEGVPLGGDGLRKTSSAGFRAASRVVRDMPAELRQQTVSVNAATGQDVTFVLSSGIEVFWGNANDTKKKSLILQTMLASLEGRSVSHIDVSSTESPIFR